MISAVSIARGPIPVRSALLIGSNPEIDALVSNTLVPGDWFLLHAPDNESALALGEKKSFELILTSRKSSGREDVEFLRRLRGNLPRARVIILAGSGSPSDLIDSIREHAFSYLSGAFSAVTLAEMIRLAAQDPCSGDGIELLDAAPGRLRAKVRCDLDSADRMLQFLKEMMAGVPAEESHALALAAREILFNAIEYGGNLDPGKSVKISYIHSNEIISCHITDPGDGFQFDNIPHAAVSNPKDDPARHVKYRLERGMRPGGFGVQVAKRALDGLFFNEKGNEALLIKYLRPALPAGTNPSLDLVESDQPS
jgi:anti-sigma regulatory factor (Ser/Thr protein kinase)/CheY-like chemotaxis protein